MKNLEKKINNYMDWCESVRDMTPMSIKNKRNALVRFAKFVDYKKFESIDNEDFNNWIKYLNSKNLSKNSINDYIGRVVSMFRYYQEMGEKTSLKIPLVRRFDGEPRRKNFYPKEIIDSVLEDADDVSGLMIRICFDTGMRLNELTNLRLSNFDGRKVHYIGKGRRWHDSWIRIETYQKLRDYVRDYEVSDYLWFELDSSKPLTNQTVANYMRKQFKRHGIDDFHTHALRHSFATNLQKQGASVEEIQHMIGHLHLSTTEEYLHGFDGMKIYSLFEKYA